jgi:hypothetical protein
MLAVPSHVYGDVSEEAFARQTSEEYIFLAHLYSRLDEEYTEGTTKKHPSFGRCRALTNMIQLK